MSTIQPSIDSSSSRFGDWLADAVELVQRVNARLRSEPKVRAEPTLRHGRKVLSDQRCLELAGLAIPDTGA
jgi:hypothetical protein